MRFASSNGAGGFAIADGSDRVEPARLDADGAARGTLVREEKLLPRQPIVPAVRDGHDADAHAASARVARTADTASGAGASAPDDVCAPGDAARDPVGA